MTTRKPLAVITGANGGIGLSTARSLWRDGYALALLYRNGHDQIDAFMRDNGDSGDDLFAIRCDLADIPTIAAAMEDPRLDRKIGALVNNAGGFVRQPFMSISVDDYDTVMDLNLKSCFLLTQWAAALMGKTGGGAIVNVASATAGVPGPGLGVYSVAKAGLVMLTRLAAQELGQFGIRVNAVSPGLIHTPMTEKAYADPEEKKHRQQMTAGGQIGHPGDVAGAIAFLCSNEARFITGQNLTIDGGAHDGMLRFLHAKKH
jgi:NAD(P)-dependent dehydrogenase (short-subunit alcohol dehydrogenase family)